MIKTVDPIVERLDSLDKLINKYLLKIKRKYKRSSNCLDNLRNYKHKGICIKCLYYFKNKNKHSEELKANLSIQVVKRILEELEAWIMRIGKEI